MFAPFNPQRNRQHREHEHGILTYAFGAEYQEQALCLVRTAKAVLDLPVTVVVDKAYNIPLTEEANVVTLVGKWNRFEYETTAWDISPYVVTFKTDADMLFPTGSMLYHPSHLPFSSGVATDVMGRITNVTAYREIEIALGLPTVYSACFSFDKSDESREFFEHLKYLFDHWYSLRIWEHLPEGVNKLIPTTDTAYSLAHLNVMGSARLDGNHFVHAKPYINNWTHEKWTQFKRFQIDKSLRMYIDGVRLSLPFHYFDKALIDNSFIQRLQHVCSLQEG